jgi:hypothetical protein
LKSTVIEDRLPFLFLDILLNHFVSDITRADGKIPPCPKVSAPKLLFQMWEFRQQHARAYPFQSMHDLADVLGPAIGNEHMDMIAGYLIRDDINFVLQRNLSQKIPGPHRNWAGENLLLVLWNPDHVDFEICLCMSAQLIKSHSDNL